MFSGPLRFTSRCEASRTGEALCHGRETLGENRVMLPPRIIIGGSSWLDGADVCELYHPAMQWSVVKPTEPISLSDIEQWGSARRNWPSKTRCRLMNWISLPIIVSYIYSNLLLQFYAWHFCYRLPINTHFDLHQINSKLHILLPLFKPVGL